MALSADSGMMSNFLKTTSVSVLVCLLLLVASAVYGQEEPVDDDQMVKDAGDPVTSVLNLPVQDNVSFGLGDYDRTKHLIKIQLIRLSLQAGSIFKVRSRSIIPLKYVPDVTSATGGVFGLGDVVLTGFFTPERIGKYSWGIGPVLSIPTATDRVLGTGKWSAGASVILVTQGKQWLAGVIAYNFWSFAGDEDRPEVNMMQIDPLFRYHLGHKWMLVSSPTILANWNAPEGEEWVVPVGGGIGKILVSGGQGWSFEVQAFYNAIRPDSNFYSEWSMRFQVQFIGIRKR